ncbi:MULTISPECIES: tape measure protein [unclassified Ensifer]|uniref:tape measure protein n=1 Tax=unclassified Ensifer TaxID=2633371 RepID=UPI00081386CD|nr:MULTISPECIES: tape measure protein [unclassified Ensifer]OCP21895.1 hypothetical protein BC361_25335 [Ensifer sp. LC54]OCP23325.1 hypothetical protein BC363_25430 [Ensifer sp. LC384]
MTAIKVELELVDGSFTTRMMHAGETLQQFNRNVARSSPALRKMAADGQMVVTSMSKASEASQGFLSTLRDVSIVTTAVSIGFNKIINIQDTWVGAVIRTNAEFERLTHMLRSMSSAADPVTDAADQVKYLVDMAREAPFQLDNLTASFTKLKATGTDPMKGSLQSLVDGVSAFGGNGEALERTILGISQASGKGVIQMEEMRQQISESMPQAMGLMAASMGVSIATLVDHIATGRMAAKPSLEAFYQELDRSFGGSAVRMMQTFSGQLSRAKTELQQFARIIGDVDLKTGDANEGGFFHTVAEQLRDFNDLLASSGGQVFAKEVGQTLSSIARGLQWAVEKAIEFRAAIGNLAEFAAFVAIGKVGISLLGSLKTGYASLSIALNMLGMNFAKANAAALLHQRALQNTSTSVASLDRLARVQATRALQGMVGAMTAVAPAAAIVGLAVYEIADAFDIFGSRGKEAIATLREFGDVARDQLGNAQKDVARRKADLTKDLQTINRAVKNSLFLGSDESKANQRSALRSQLEEEYDVAQRQAQIRKDEELLKQAEIKAIEDDAKKATDFALRELDRREAAEQRAYRDRQAAIQKEMDERIAAESKAGRSIDQLEKERTERLAENARNLYETQRKLIQGALDDVWAKNKSDGPMQLADQLKIDELTKKLDELRQKREALNITGELPSIGASSTTERDLEKLEKLFGKTQDEVHGLEDKLGGANDELGEFLAKFARGAYGDTSVTQVRELGEEIANLILKKAALEEMNEGAEDLQSDIENARIKLIEKRMELEQKALGRELTEGEKIRMKIEQGGYKGLGPNSPALAALQESVRGMTMQGRVTDAVGVSMDKAFGQQTIGKITTMNDVLRETMGIVSGIGTSLNGLSFDSLSMMNSPFGGGAPRITAFSGSMLDLIAKGESGGNYNATLDNGAWTGGSQNLVGMSLKQVRDLQRMMLANPANRAKYGDGKGSSALGKYQIVGQTLEGLIREMGLSGDELFDEKMQDAMASHLLNRRLTSGEGLAGLRKEWTSLANVSDGAINQALSNASRGPTVEKAAGFEMPRVNLKQPFDINNPFAGPSVVDTNQVYGEANAFLEKRNQLIEAGVAATTELTDEENRLTAAQKAQAADDQKTEMVRKIEEAKESLDGLDKNYRAVSKLIAKGDFGDKNMNSEKNKELLRIARELDEAENKRADRKEAAGNVEGAEVRIKEQELQLQRQINELKAKAKDPNVRLESSGLVQMREDMDKYVRDLETVYGKDSEQYRAGIEKKRQALAMFGQTELLQDVANSNSRTRELQRGLMSESAARQAAMNQELAEVDAKMAYYKQAGLLDVEATRQFEAEKAQIRKQYAAQDPMSKQMREWSDLQGNLQKQSTQWMDTLAGGITDLIMGTGDWKQALQSIARDIINTWVKKIMSGFMGPKQTVGAAPAAKQGKGASSLLTKGKGVAVGSAHTGAILGRGVHQTRMVNPSVFKNAKKYHSGANQIGGQRLLPGEIPIIAKKDEGIFTKEQMGAIGAQMNSGGQVNQVSINAPVTVNASGGTPEQNTDLAKQISSQIEGTMRGVVVDELSRQMRPGNLLSAGKGR